MEGSRLKLKAFLSLMHSRDGQRFTAPSYILERRRPKGRVVIAKAERHRKAPLTARQKIARRFIEQLTSGTRQWKYMARPAQIRAGAYKLADQLLAARASEKGE